ncbi:MAG: hypothetical protein KDI79_06950 [Anaerolineae bacterium]|nr:hypothetical protein [Anaerolineae bacterium]
MTPTNGTPYTEADIEAFIREQFADNLERIMFDGGQPLTEDSKQAALNQILLYWRRMRAIATRVTDTEVRLNLPQQTSPAGRVFGIEGIVDIIREDDQTIMYDIKSHDLEYVRANTGLYQQQLNVYAHIWQELHQQQLDQTAVIATAYPDGIAEALADGNEQALEDELTRWDPLVEIEFDAGQVEATIQAFGTVVDAIEAGEFTPPSSDTLAAPMPGSRSIFGRRICRLCDVRFSCCSYREYAGLQRRRTRESTFHRYFNDYGTDRAVEVRRTARLETLSDEEMA